MDRYARQLVLPGFGADAQQRLGHARVLVVGAGGLGSPVLAYLAGAGVGRLTIADADTVDRTNLHRQVIYADADAGAPKAELAARFVTRLNPEVVAVPLVRRVESDVAGGLVAEADLIMDCCDNLPTRYVLNRACVAAGVPYVWAAIGRYAGRCSTVRTGAPCFECLLGPQDRQPELPSVDEAGVFGPICGTMGALAAAEAIKVLTGVGDPLTGRLVNVDVRTSEAQVIDISRDPECAACGTAS